MLGGGKFANIEENKSLLGDGQADQFYKIGMEVLTTNVDKLLSGSHTYGLVIEGSVAAGVGLVGGTMIAFDQGGTSTYAFVGLEGALVMRLTELGRLTLQL